MRNVALNIHGARMKADRRRVQRKPEEHMYPQRRELGYRKAAGRTLEPRKQEAHTMLRTTAGCKNAKLRLHDKAAPGGREERTRRRKMDGRILVRRMLEGRTTRRRRPVAPWSDCMVSPRNTAMRENSPGPRRRVPW